MPQYRLRLGRRYLPNHYYHLTTVTQDRRPVFSELYSARALIQKLRSEAQAGTVNSIAFVVMPDHFHWLVQSIDGDISSLMRRVKTRTSRALGKPIWQLGFHDHCLRAEDDIRHIARYIIANPVRANLVRNVRYYPHWDVVYLK